MGFTGGQCWAKTAASPLFFLPFFSIWLPGGGRVPAGQDIAKLCAAALLSSPTAIYTVDAQLIATFGLERLSDDQIDALLRSISWAFAPACGHILERVPLCR